MRANIHAFIALLRLDKPIGIWLLFFPAGWAVALTARDHVLYDEALMLLGAAITRAAGCIMNDLTDRKLDAQVERTRNRPLAAGVISVPVALVILAMLLLAALAIALSLPRSIFWLALLALPMIAAYPWMKRITWWPQLFLGLTFNLSALFGWLATGTPLMLPAFTLYVAAIFWTLGYDTIYAVQDMADDSRIGIRSSALAAGGRLPWFIAVFYTLMIGLLGLTGYLLHAGPLYYLGVTVAALHACWQQRQLPPLPARAGAIFRSNQWLGGIILLAIVADRWA